MYCVAVREVARSNLVRPDHFLLFWNRLLRAREACCALCWSGIQRAVMRASPLFLREGSPVARMFGLAVVRGC